MRFMNGHLLLVEDDPDMADLLTQVLAYEGFSIKHAASIKAAKQALTADIQLALLDVGLPDGNGFDLLRDIRESHPNLPVIMLTARGEAMDRVLGLELGADDYLPKPFETRELTARIRAVLRRAMPESAEPGSVITLDTRRREARFEGQLLDLTGAEFDLLVLLIQHTPDPVSKDELSEQALGKPLGAFDRAVDVHISRLRKKLGEGENKPKIVAIRNRGYQWLEPA